MLSGEGNSGERWKTTIGLISKKNNFTPWAHFFAHFFAVVLHDYNRYAKLPEIFLWRPDVVRVLVHFLFTAAHFLLALLVVASFSHFVTAATKFPRCSSIVLYLSL